jgi:hypothetical protein
LWKVALWGNGRIFNKRQSYTLDKIGRVIYVDIRFGMIQMQSESGTSYGLPPSEFIKPYLRPMSSMTEEEYKEFSVLAVGTHLFKGPLIPSYDTLDWLNKHHFDYRGLIKKGLAIGVTKENNPYKE